MYMDLSLSRGWIYKLTQKAALCKQKQNEVEILRLVWLKLAGNQKKQHPVKNSTYPLNVSIRIPSFHHHRIPKFHKPGPSTNTTSRSKNRHQVSMHSLDPHRPRTWTIGISPGSTCTHRIHVWYIYLTLPTKILYKINHSYVMLCAKKK